MVVMTLRHGVFVASRRTMSVSGANRMIARFVAR